MLLDTVFCRISTDSTHVGNKSTTTSYFAVLFYIMHICASTAVYITSTEVVWAQRPRGKPPPCSLELRERLVSLEPWNQTRLIRTTSGWRHVRRRGCRAGSRVYQQQGDVIRRCPAAASFSFSFDFAVASCLIRLPKCTVAEQ